MLRFSGATLDPEKIDLMLSLHKIRTDPGWSQGFGLACRLFVDYLPKMDGKWENRVEGGRSENC